MKKGDRIRYTCDSDLGAVEEIGHGKFAGKISGRGTGRYVKKCDGQLGKEGWIVTQPDENPEWYVLVSPGMVEVI